MIDTQNTNKFRHMRLSGMLLIGLSVLLAAICVLYDWLHPPVDLNDWEFTPIPWDLWTRTFKFVESKVPYIALSVPILVGLWQLFGKPCLINTILRCLAYVWLCFVWIMALFSLLLAASFH